MQYDILSMSRIIRKQLKSQLLHLFCMFLFLYKIYESRHIWQIKYFIFPWQVMQYMVPDSSRG